MKYDELKNKLHAYGASEKDIRKFIAHIEDFCSKKTRGVFNVFALDYAYKAYVAVDAVGLKFDGVNAVCAGERRFFFTVDGYKNKVLQSHPEAKFDYGLVHEGDEFKVAKESGTVIYSHSYGDPFSNTTAIVGAYVVLKTDQGEYIELLNQATFNEMQKTAMNAATWKQWPSEFWLKSAMKRACKRHFKEEVKEIDKIDNDDYGLTEMIKDESIADKVGRATSVKELVDLFNAMTPDEKRTHTDLLILRKNEIESEGIHAVA